MSKLKFCPICGREHKCTTEMCAKHYRQWKIYGKCLDSNPRNQYDPNEIRIKDTYGEIDTYNIDCEVNCTYKFDLEDIHFLQGKKWRTTFKRGVPYLCTGHTIYFHKLVCQTDLSVDHINRDTTDNRKSNLRPATNTLQQVNQNVQKTNTSGFTGVFYSNRHNVWHAELSYNKKRYFGPTVETKEEAIFTRMCLEKKFLKDLLRPIDDYAPYIKKLTKERKLSLIKFIKNKFK